LHSSPRQLQRVALPPLSFFTSFIAPAVILIFQQAVEKALKSGGRKRRHQESQRMSTQITVADVERVAELAHLELAQEEIQPMLRDLTAILDYIAELNQLDTAGIEPLAQVGELENAAIPQPRPDVVAPSLDRAAVMAQAPETDGAFFKVPKVIEK
jgi:aspartyl-tRNA(Asn)/glutamyl-tRNA(Gln) amidotransferase subunit C